MKTQWVDLHDGATWCNAIVDITGSDGPKLVDRMPTCVACIAQAARFYALPNIRRRPR